MRFHFISGLPRSGSTLLSAILKQNPRFHSGISSSLFPLFTSAMTVMAGEDHRLIPDARRENVLRGLFTAWAADVTDRDILFDTNRYWTSRLPALLALFPDAKVICTVRNVAAIMDSLERLQRANPLLPSRLFSEAERDNVYTRTDALSQRDRLVGGPWTCLKEAFYGPDARSILVVDYDYLATAPAKVVALIYAFLGEPEFPHDFDNLQFDEPDYDRELRLPGLHKIRPKVDFETRTSLIPHDLYQRFSEQNFWRDGRHSIANRITAQPDRDDGENQTPIEGGAR